MMTGVSFVHVLYRGASPALTDLLGGQVQVLFEALPASIEHIKSGSVRALAVTTPPDRRRCRTDRPVGEFVTSYEASSWNGLLAPKSTPVEIRKRLNRVINAGLAHPKVKARLADLGAATLPGSAADFGNLITEETEKWRRVVWVANIKLSKQPIREHTSVARAVSGQLAWKITHCDNQNSETAAIGRAA